MIERNNGSRNRTKNGWKYLSFVLIGILAFGITAAALPQAMAKESSDLLQLVIQTRDLVLGIDDKVNPSNGIHLLKTVNLAPNAETDIELIPDTTDTIYVGTVNFGFAGSSPDRAVVDCGLGGGVVYDSALEPPTNQHVTRDFACKHLTLRLFDNNGANLFVQVQVIAGYEEIPAQLET